MLEKIRAEIEHWESDDTQDEYQIGAMDMKNYVLRVIDKYAEQEPTDKSNLEKICEELAAENDDLRDQLAMRDGFKIEPCDDVARERYKDLCEYFGDTKDILKSRKDFKAWLERIKWHVRKAEELYEKYEHKQEPCDDVVSRQAVINLVRGRNSALEEPRIFNSHNSGVVFEHYINDLPSVRPQEQTGQFAEWVAREIFDDMWEYNKDAFAEIACRKLAKLGIVREKGDVWELVEPQESEDV